MTTYNFTNGSITGQPKVADSLPNTTGLFTRSNIVDFANQNLDSGNNDVASVINIPADTWVLSVAARIITAETNDAEMDIGTGLDYDQWTSTIAEVDAAALAANATIATDWAPEYFASADTIDITNNNNDVDFDTLKVEIVALMLPGNKSDNDGNSMQST